MAACGIACAHTCRDVGYYMRGRIALSNGEASDGIFRDQYEQIGPPDPVPLIWKATASPV